MKKTTAGFTLVELIVVIAILAILAGIAIPVYSGYIAKANEASDMQMLDSVRTATVFAVVDKDAEAKLTGITYSGDPTNVTVTVTVPDGHAAINSVNISAYVGTENYQFKGTTNTWYWSAAGWSTTAPSEG